MTDEELIERLRDCSSDEAMWSRQAADRIEALVKEQNYWIERCGRERAFASSHRVRAERLEDALKRARDFIERGGRDRIGPVLRQIDAALKGDQK